MSQHVQEPFWPLVFEDQGPKWLLNMFGEGPENVKRFVGPHQILRVVEPRAHLILTPG